MKDRRSYERNLDSREIQKYRKQQITDINKYHTAEHGQEMNDQIPRTEFFRQG